MQGRGRNMASRIARQRVQFAKCSWMQDLRRFLGEMTKDCFPCVSCVILFIAHHTQTHTHTHTHHTHTHTQHTYKLYTHSDTHTHTQNTHTTIHIKIGLSTCLRIQRLFPGYTMRIEMCFCMLASPDFHLKILTFPCTNSRY